MTIHKSGRIPREVSVVDLRSDTVTEPTQEMRDAMATAGVGDDVYGDDPTTNLLQQELAELVGFEAALWLPTGTMSNQVAMAVHAGRGAEVILPAGSHIADYEAGALSAVNGLVPREVRTVAGVPDVLAVEKAIRNDLQQAPTGVIAVENTHNKAGGTV